MDERADSFVAAFQAFLDEVVDAHRRQATSDTHPLLPVLQEFLGTDPRQLPVVAESIASHLFVDLDVALADLQGRPGEHALIGIGGGEQRRHTSLSEILEGAARWGHFPVGPVDYRSIPTGPDTARQAVSFGLRLFRYEQAPVVVLQRPAEPQFGHQSAQMEVLTSVDGVAARLIAEVRELMVRRSVLRGQVLSLGGSAYEPGIGGIVFHRRPGVHRDDVILPDGVLDRVYRHIAGVAEHREALQSAGQHLKRGMLLHGAPGTGKTHTVRYLIGALQHTTVILLAGPSIQFIAEAAEMARVLQPSLVVLEDCDLVAENRDHYPGAQPLLFTVLEQLDGLADDADVAFLLTTNRVSVLEPALAQRPGRVDLAIEVPMPDEPARHRLTALYARGLPLSPDALRTAAARTAGTTASFAKELVRRAVLFAAEQGEPVGDHHLEHALDEMLSDAEHLTRSLLGSMPPAGDMDR